MRRFTPRRLACGPARGDDEFARHQDKVRFRVRPWIVWSTGLLAYIVAVLDRTTLGVSGLDAADRFAASPGVLATFVVIQVIVYPGAQIPAGLLLDR